MASSKSSADIIEFSNIIFHEVIGQGGFGTVHRVSFQTPIKGHAVGASKSAPHLQRGEVEILTSLEHPNIVKLLGVYSQGPFHGLLLEYAQLGSLHDYLRKDPTSPLPGKLIGKWVRESALALQFLHANSVIHRDVKANNCLLFEGNVLKLSDFGLAREINHSETTSTALKGTYSYMAPEIIETKGNTNRAKYSKRTDIYAYGMLVLEICTRAEPYKAKEWQYIVFHVPKGNLKPAIPPNCPEKLADIMKRCWQLDPKQRPSIDEILQDLTTTVAAPFHIKHWSLEKEFSFKSEGLLAYRVACCPNGDIVVADRAHNRLYLINAEGTYKQDLKRTDEEDQTRTSEMCVADLAVTSQGTILAVNLNNKVLVFDSKGMQLPSFPTITFDEDPKTDVVMTGVCIDRDDNILIRDIKRGVITVHKQDGKITSKLKVNSQGANLESTAVNSKKHILLYSKIPGKSYHIGVTDERCCKILFQISPKILDANTRFVIRKVVFDSVDNIYVAMTEIEGSESVLNTGHIHKYNSRGVFEKCIAQGLFLPKDVSITSDGSLAIASRNSVLIYSYK